jgi:magnesium transporter
MSVEWHDISDPSDPELDRLAERYQLHPLHIEDCRHRDQIAKIEENSGYLFVVLKPVETGEDQTLETSDLNIFVGRDFLITVQEGGKGSAARVVEHMRTAWRDLRADQACYRIMDGIVDSYLPILDRFSEVIDELGNEVLEKPAPSALARIFDTRRSLIQLRRVLGNTRDVAGHLQRTGSDLIGRDLWPFLRDLYDHLARNLDMVEIQRDLLNGALDIYLTSLANRTNQVMKVLTVLGTIALPALIVSGLYGMNVEGLPFKNHPHAFTIVTGGVAALSAVFLAVLKLFHWL